MDDKNKIIAYAEEKFSTLGFFKTTMDELAKEMRISKKTIYKHFSSKNILVKAVLDTVRFSISSLITKIVEGDDNAVVKLYKISELLSRRISKISAAWLNDLRIHAPELWNEIEQFRKMMIQKNLTLIVEQGKREGLIVDKPTVIILTIILSSVQAVVNPEFVINNNLSMREAAKVTLDVVFSGILTKKGRKIFKEFKSGNQNE